MIRHLSGSITKWLITSNAIDKEDTELYEYAIYSLFITLSPVFLVLCFGIFTGMVLQGIVLILPFLTIRKYSGGYHAKNPLVCFFSSCILLILMLLAAAYLDNGAPVQAALGLSCILLILLSPIDSANRRLDGAEKRKYKRMTIYILIFYFVIYLVLTLLSCRQYAVCIALGIILTAGLQLPCCISRTPERL